MHVRRATAAAVVAALLGATTPIAAQDADRAAAETAAHRLATEDILRIALDQSKYRGSQAAAILGDPSWPADYAVATAVVLSDDDETQQEMIVDVLNSGVEFGTAVAMELAAERDYAANLLRNRIAAAARGRVDPQTSEQAEIERNELITHDVAVRAKTLVGRLPAMRAADFGVARDALAARFRDALLANPQLRAAVLEEQRVSEPLRRSRARVAALFEEARASK